MLKQRSQTHIVEKYLPKKPTINLPEHKPSKGPSSPIVAATPTFKDLVQPRDADRMEEAKVNEYKISDLVSLSLYIRDLRTPSPPY